MSPRILPPRRRVALPLAAAARVAVVALIALIAVACGSSTPSAVTIPTATSASPSDTVPPPPSGSPSAVVPSVAPETPEPSVDAHGVPALEGVLPTRIGTVDLEIRSLTGGDFYALGTAASRAQLDAMLKDLDRAVTDLTVADAYDPSGLSNIEIGAFRVAGTQPAQLLGEWVAATQASKPGKISVSNATVAGRSVTKLVDSTVDVGPTTYAFAVDDTIFLVRAADPAMSSEALGKLPKS